MKNDFRDSLKNSRLTKIQIIAVHLDVLFFNHNDLLNNCIIITKEQVLFCSDCCKKQSLCLEQLSERVRIFFINFSGTSVAKF